MQSTVMLKGYYSFFSHQTWTPSVNLYETEHCYLVCVDLAGVEKQQIDIEVTGLRLILKGSRTVPVSSCNENDPAPQPIRLHLMEIDHGPFLREVELPQNVEREKIAARAVNGMLWIELPKKP
jgi:HSP20 family protein